MDVVDKERQQAMGDRPQEKRREAHGVFTAKDEKNEVRRRFDTAAPAVKTTLQSKSASIMASGVMLFIGQTVM